MRINTVDHKWSEMYILLYPLFYFTLLKDTKFIIFILNNINVSYVYNSTISFSIMDKRKKNKFRGTNVRKATFKFFIIDKSLL